MPAEAFGRIVSTVPMGHMAEPEEMAKVALSGLGRIPASSRVSNCLPMAAERKSDYC